MTAAMTASAASNDDDDRNHDRAASQEQERGDIEREVNHGSTSSTAACIPRMVSALSRATASSCAVRLKALDQRECRLQFGAREMHGHRPVQRTLAAYVTVLPAVAGAIEEGQR